MPSELPTWRRDQKTKAQKAPVALAGNLPDQDPSQIGSGGSFATHDGTGGRQLIGTVPWMLRGSSFMERPHPAMFWEAVFIVSLEISLPIFPTPSTT
jgi:hypothetical protein